jgi:hypothetical protein
LEDGIRKLHGVINRFEAVAQGNTQLAVARYKEQFRTYKPESDERTRGDQQYQPETETDHRHHTRERGHQQYQPEKETGHRHHTRERGHQQYQPEKETDHRHHTRERGHQQYQPEKGVDQTKKGSNDSTSKQSDYMKQIMERAKKLSKNSNDFRKTRAKEKKRAQETLEAAEKSDPSEQVEDGKKGRSTTEHKVQSHGEQPRRDAQPFSRGQKDEGLPSDDMIYLSGEESEYDADYDITYPATPVRTMHHDNQQSSVNPALEDPYHVAHHQPWPRAEGQQQGQHPSAHHLPPLHAKGQQQGQHPSAHHQPRPYAGGQGHNLDFSPDRRGTLVDSGLSNHRGDPRRTRDYTPGPPYDGKPIWVLREELEDENSELNRLLSSGYETGTMVIQTINGRINALMQEISKHGQFAPPIQFEHSTDTLIAVQPETGLVNSLAPTPTVISSQPLIDTTQINYA